MRTVRRWITFDFAQACRPLDRRRPGFARNRDPNTFEAGDVYLPPPVSLPSLWRPRSAAPVHVSRRRVAAAVRGHFLQVLLHLLAEPYLLIAPGLARKYAAILLGDRL